MGSQGIHRLGAHWDPPAFLEVLSYSRSTWGRLIFLYLVLSSPDLQYWTSKFYCCCYLETALPYASRYLFKLIGGTSYLAWIAMSPILQQGFFFFVSVFLCCLWKAGHVGFNLLFECEIFILFCFNEITQSKVLTGAAQVKLVFTPKLMIHWCLTRGLKENID